MRTLHIWRRIFVHGVPFVLALCAILLLLPWIMGASAIHGGAAASGYNVGMAALFLYPAAYQVLIAAWGLSHWLKWPTKPLFLQLIWFSVVLFAAAMAYAFVQVQDYVQGT
jgi:hypothetical protein